MIFIKPSLTPKDVWKDLYGLCRSAQKAFYIGEYLTEVQKDLQYLVRDKCFDYDIVYNIDVDYLYTYYGEPALKLVFSIPQKFTTQLRNNLL